MARCSCHSRLKYGIVGDVVKRGLRLLLQEAENSRAAAFSATVSFAKRTIGRRVAFGLFWSLGFRLFVTFQNDMGIGAPEAEGIDSDNKFPGFFECRFSVTTSMFKSSN